MSDWKAQLRGEGFKDVHIEQTDHFMTLVIGLLRIDLRNASRLKAGVTKLAIKVNSLVPALEEGKEAGPVGPDDLRDAMRPLSDDAIIAFIGITGEILLSGQDGPMGCAIHLKETIDRLVQKMEAGSL
jgi:hypothetical protein